MYHLPSFQDALFDSEALLKLYNQDAHDARLESKQQG
jgi:hypothetical protein